MAEIDITRVGDGTYEITVDDDTSSSIHTVSIETADLDRLGRGGTPDDLLRASFRFLLDREPKESILANFDLSVISRYFPEYPERLADYL